MICQKINYSLKTYKKKWFKFARKADYKPFLEKLKIDHGILDKRLKSLFDILKVKQCFNKTDDNDNDDFFLDNVIL